MRAADAVAPNLPYPPEERLSVRDVKPLARSKCRRRRRGTPPRRNVDCGSQWRFLRLRACAHQGFWKGSEYGESTIYKLYRNNGCIAVVRYEQGQG
jgi:hypothetical protein